MRYKISNTATAQELELFTGATFKYPKLYKPITIISGAEETVIPIITQGNTKSIDLAIWGLLPKDYDGDWQDFQEVINTLTLSYDKVKDNSLFESYKNLKPCVILLTGFFTTYLFNGKTYPYYIYNDNKKPIYVAGLYNVLDDGFITVSIIVEKAKTDFNEILNISKRIPKVLSSADKEKWLSSFVSEKNMLKLIKRKSKLLLKAHPVAKELYRNNVPFDRLLDPVFDSHLPKLKIS